MTVYVGRRQEERIIIREVSFEKFMRSPIKGSWCICSERKPYHGIMDW